MPKLIILLICLLVCDLPSLAQETTLPSPFPVLLPPGHQDQAIQAVVLPLAVIMAGVAPAAVGKTI